MTIGEVLAEVDEVKPNTFSDETKVRWISELDGKVFHEVILTHEHEDGITFNGYTMADLSTTLLVGFPYSDIYRNYLFAMIDFNNGESDRYQMSYAMFTTSYEEFIVNYNRTHLPVNYKMQLF